MRGSSPHTRGTPHRHRSRCRCRGDHPRIRGEHHHAIPAHERRRGIIPAYAGNTSEGLHARPLQRGSSPHTRGTLQRCISGSESAWDHPRIRGEHQRRHSGIQNGTGIIPAYAGNTLYTLVLLGSVEGSSPHTRGTRCRRRPCGGRCRDHPRIRGEHEIDAPASKHVFGIIPAYAGNTASASEVILTGLGSSPHTRGTRRGSPRCSPCPRDHPRIRGEHLQRQDVVEQRLGIIPAYAGNTLNYQPLFWLFL